MKKVLVAFVVWRVITLLVAGFSPIFLPVFGAKFPYYHERLIATNLPHFLWAFGNFDGVHYLGIAQSAYSAQFTQAFFPLYPLVIRIFSLLTFGNLFWSAFLLSNIFFLLALIVFYKLIARHYDQKKALWSVIFMLAFPTSFYFGAIYTESLFLLLTLCTFVLIDKKKYFLAAVTGFLATLTRLIGVFLGLILLLFSKGKWRYLGAGIVALGLLAYMLYLQVNFGNPIYFLTSQSEFGQGRDSSKLILLPQVIFRYIKILLTTQGLLRLNAVFELTSTVFALAILAYSYKKVKSSWLLFSFLSVLLPTLTGTLASMPRYILVAFPIYVVLGSLKSTPLKLLILAIFMLVGFVSLTLFSQGYWVA